MPSRPSCSVFIAVSLDGYIARPDGGLDWLSVVEAPGEDYGYERFFSAIDTVILGRKTYDVVLGFDPWPYRGKRCVVLTHGTRAPRHDEELYDGPIDALVDRLGHAGSERIYVDGGVVISSPPGS